jgi:hypothetical protein
LRTRRTRHTTASPFAIGEDPLILDDVFFDGRFNQLDIALTEELEQLIMRRYNGPGQAYVDEGDHCWEGMVLSISGDADQPFDPVQVARGLRRIFDDGLFDRRFVEIVKRTEAIHLKVRKALEEGVSTPDLDYERRRLALQRTTGK